jgi:hypothetical protein
MVEPDERNDDEDTEAGEDRTADEITGKDR